MLKVRPRLKKLMKEKGITQAVLSEMTGIPQPSISRFDRNIQHLDSHMFTIAKALGVSVDDLFEIEE
ncbi:helix-turn-helix transcriptional regulator [Priestia megaterium]|uniref:helix-turn-helix domain-containing protein n=1 Tax=Priestia megaterium TaxID=1404 RepID=UPI002D8070B2|nr:helix-turn-helix transcriptional regulator [Priestia megaterium]MEB4872117.1 helix-turn-helix transcriptional regulator [Priestia megaterium]